MPIASLCLALLAFRDPAPITLARKFVKNEKFAYSVTSHITAEMRQKGLQTFIPSDLDIDYAFNYTVQSLLPDGFAVLRFQQPTMTETEGETATSAPRPKTTKSDKVYLHTVSPVNEVVDTKDITPKKAAPKKKGGTATARWTMSGAPPQAPIFGEYIGEMHRLALFIGSLDFAPPLPLEPIRVGDTWKRTVSYQPQKLKGKNKSAVQRLDYVFTYLGPMKVAGKPVLRVQAKLDLNTDLADYLKTILEGMQEGLSKETNLKTMPLHMRATIDFDLDPTTRHTLSAAATSEGGFELFVKEDDEAYYEERFKGRTNLDLVGRKIVR